MIQIYPDIEFQQQSPYGNGTLIPKKVIWQGMHTCVETECSITQRRLIATLPSGHGSLNQYIVNPETSELFCSHSVRRWFGEPLLQSLTHPQQDEVVMTIEKFRPAKKVVILNTIDYLYGHSLLKLLNAERHLLHDKKFGLVVIVQHFLRWMVPDGVAEVWTVHLPLAKGRNYYPSLSKKIEQECKRFTQIYLSKAHSHPSVKDISLFTRVNRYEGVKEQNRITFIWRDDRPWFGNRYAIAAGKKLGMMPLFRFVQKIKIILLFKRLKKKFPDKRYTVAGAGTDGTFPSWIDDQRVNQFTPEIERTLCRVYAESNVVIGVHGSNMLLPSAYADITIDLMPTERWGNIAQDVIFQERDVRLAVFRYRFVPIQMSSLLLARFVMSAVEEREQFRFQMIQ